MPTSTFASDLGQLVAVRCLGSQQPGALCMYGGYQTRPLTSAAMAAWRGCGVRATVLAAGLTAAMAAYLLM